jgi:hypothetical protein
MLTGTQSQIEWAEKIRPTVVRAFDRVTAEFEVRAGKQSGEVEAETRLILAILAQKRAETMANARAGYFIKNWQSLSDQVRQMIAADPRYQAIKNARAARRATSVPADAAKT